MKHSIQIPFCGFYESEASSIIDDAFNDAFYYDDSGNYNVPDYAWFNLDTSEARRELVEAYLDGWCEAFTDATGLELKGKFDGMSSPKFYNFETDRIFLEVDALTVAKLFEASEADNHETLTAVIKRRHTSYDGFWSYYTNDASAWLAKPVLEYDHNELETLLIAVLEISAPDWDEDYKFRCWELLEGWTGNGGASNAVWAGMPEKLREYADLQREFGKPMSWELFEATGKAYDDGMTLEELQALQAAGEEEVFYPRCDKTLELPL